MLLASIHLPIFRPLLYVSRCSLSLHISFYLSIFFSVRVFIIIISLSLQVSLRIFFLLSLRLSLCNFHAVSLHLSLFIFHATFRPSILDMDMRSANIPPASSNEFPYMKNMEDFNRAETRKGAPCLCSALLTSISHKVGPDSCSEQHTPHNVQNVLTTLRHVAIKVSSPASYSTTRVRYGPSSRSTVKL